MKFAPHLAVLALAAATAACGNAAAGDAAAADHASDSAPAPAVDAALAAAQADSVRNALIARADLGRIKGNAQSSTWVIVISDFQCPFCKRWHEETAPRIEREYARTGKVRMAYLNFPIPSHRNAQPAHELAMCASEQDRFWPVADAIFATQASWKGRSDVGVYFDSLARTLVLDHGRLQRCIRDGTTRPLIRADYDRSVRIGIGSTPTFIIGSQTIIGAQPYEAFAAAIDAALAAAAAGPPARPSTPPPGR